MEFFRADVFSKKNMEMIKLANRKNNLSGIEERPLNAEEIGEEEEDNDGES